MKILMFGATGQVAWACLQEAEKRGIDIKALARDDVDFCNPVGVYDAVISNHPDIVINAVAYTAVDQAEQEEDKAFTINSESVGSLAKACGELDIPLIHISTDYVFDGTSKQPYKETDTVSPLGVYGRSKLAGEELVKEHCPKHIILRTSWVFGVHGNNFVKTMLRLAATRDSLSVVDDQVGKPTFAGDIASVILDLASIVNTKNSFEWGVYHLAGNRDLSWYSFALEIFNRAVELGVLEKAPKVMPIPSSEYPTPVTRPNYSVLNCESLEKVIGYEMNDWGEGLLKVLRSI